jgi:lipoprotein-releasing system permease protein
LEFGIAWRYLRSRRGSKLVSLVSLIAILGVTVGVAALVATVGVMNGLREDIRDKILTGAPDVYVIAYGPDMVMPDWRRALGKIERQPGVVAAAPFVQTQALIRRGSSRVFTTVFVKGIPAAERGSPNVTSIRQHATAGDFTFATRDGERHGAVLGARLAEQFKVTPGADSIVLIGIDPDRVDPATGYPVPHSATFEVTGIFETGLYEYDQSYVIVSLAAAQELAGLGDAITGIEVRTPTRDTASVVAATLRDSLGSNFATRDWHEQNDGLFAALRLEKLGMSISLLLISIVAAFNIISTLTMAVTDKVKEIGILRAMGMSARSIRLVFFVQGMVIGVAGTAFGLVIGLGVAELIGREKLISLDPTIYLIDHLPVATQPLDIVLIVLANLGIAALAAVYPAQRAARLLPIEAIRHD